MLCLLWPLFYCSGLPMATFSFQYVISVVPSSCGPFLIQCFELKTPRVYIYAYVFCSVTIHLLISVVSASRQYYSLLDVVFFVSISSYRSWSWFQFMDPCFVFYYFLCRILGSLSISWLLCSWFLTFKTHCYICIRWVTVHSQVWVLCFTVPVLA